MTLLVFKLDLHLKNLACSGPAQIINDGLCALRFMTMHYGFEEGPSKVKDCVQLHLGPSTLTVHDSERKMSSFAK